MVSHYTEMTEQGSANESPTSTACDPLASERRGIDNLLSELVVLYLEIRDRISTKMELMSEHGVEYKNAYRDFDQARKILKTYVKVMVIYGITPSRF